MDTPYSFTVDEKPSYLHVKVDGQNNRPTVLKYLSDTYDACMQRGHSVVLIEENLRGPGFSVGEIYAIIAEAAGKFAGGIRQVAYVDTNPEHQDSRMKFAETVARNRAINVRMFSNVGDAEQWLATSQSGRKQKRGE